MTSFLQDIRYSLRMITKAPGLLVIQSLSGSAHARLGYNRSALTQVAPGTRLGPYEVLSPVSVRAPWVWYTSALDPRLDRQVAIKLLPARLGRRPTGAGTPPQRGDGRRGA